ncbi:MAG TPA: hypothetical protein VIJ71_05560 [Mycobacteriales bacterium]
MNPVDDLTFLDPVATPPPADSSERAAVRRRGRRRRLARLSLTSSPVVLAVAAAVAVGIAVTAGSNTQATVVPARPTQLNMTGAASTAPGCPTGKVVDTITRAGQTYTAVAALNGGLPDYVCARLTDGSVLHQVQSGEGLEPFPDGAYLAVDGLGHVFANIDPGNVTGVLVLVSGRDTVKMLGIYQGSVDQTTSDFALTIAQRLCDPNCAEGGSLHFRAVWDAATDTYVLRDNPMNLMMGLEVTLSGSDASIPPNPLAPETYRTSTGSTVYPAWLADDTNHDLIRWRVTTGARAFTVRLADYAKATPLQACTASGGTSAVDGHVVAPHTSYNFDVSCPFDPASGAMAVAYAPGGKVVARWIRSS